MTSLTIKSSFAKLNLQSSIVAIMTVDPATVRPDSTIVEARLHMNELGVNQFAVVNDQHQVVGILSKHDFRKSALEKRSQVALTKNCTCANTSCKSRQQRSCSSGPLVKDIMSETTISFSPDDTLGFAAETFLQQMFHVAPVIEDEKFVGLLTSHDLLRCAFANVLPLQA